MDEGPETNEISIIAATEPAQPDPPIRLSSSLSSITIEWTTPDDGGSELLSYTLQRNVGTGSSVFSDIATDIDPTSTSKTLADLTTGQ